MRTRSAFCRELFLIYSNDHEIRFRQREIQQQLEKLLDLIGLVVEKMEIRSEINNDGTLKYTNSERFPSLQRFRQTLAATRRFQSLQSASQNRISKLFKQQS